MFGWSFVFHGHIPKARLRQIVEDTAAAAPWWCKVPGAQVGTSRKGLGRTWTRRGDHPVVHVSWNDAEAYARWSGQRLPTEAEWEFAARGGLVQKLYPWGDKLRPEGEHRCNIWQGEFPVKDTADDGYAGTCPVQAFAPNGFGLYSMTGNAWEWCADWFDADYGRTGTRDNPRGPEAGEVKVLKGGSFLVPQVLLQSLPSGSADKRNTPDSSTANIGFRCAVSL